MEEQNLTSKPVASAGMQQPSVAELTKQLEALKAEQAEFNENTDRWISLESKINKISEQLNKPQ